jgi:hypothetical protein
MSTPARIRRSKDLLGVSATAFLTLCLWVGPHAACWLVATAAIVATWVAICRRFPAVGYLTGIFVVGFVQGLWGYGRRTRRW